MQNTPNSATPRPIAETADGIAVYCAHDKLVDLAELVPNPRNPNKHPQSQLSRLGAIIKAQGWRAPITVSTRSGFIVRGEGRFLTAVNEGWTEAPVDYQDYKDEAAEWADLIADNRLAELSVMDDDGLDEMLAELDQEARALAGFEGWEPPELGEPATPSNSISSGEVDTSDFDTDNFDHICPRCGFMFDDRG